MAPTTPPTTRSADEREAVLRIDAEPGAKRFQGVWLDFGGERWVIAYRAHDFWTPFENHAVIVTGACYTPPGQAIGATHFRVDRMRFVTPERGRGPILELGPERVIRGRFAEHAFPADSKRADAPALTFVDDAGTAYWLAGGHNLPAAGTAARVKAREVIPDLSYAAQPGGPSLWILDVRDPDPVDNPAYAPTITKCP